MIIIMSVKRANKSTKSSALWPTIPWNEGSTVMIGIIVFGTEDPGSSRCHHNGQAPSLDVRAAENEDIKIKVQNV